MANAADSIDSMENNISVDEISKIVEGAFLNAKNLADLEQAILSARAFGFAWQKDLNKQSREAVAKAVRDKVYELVFSAGEIPEFDLLYLCGVFGYAPIESNLEQNSSLWHFAPDLQKYSPKVPFANLKPLDLPRSLSCDISSDSRFENYASMSEQISSLETSDEKSFLSSLVAVSLMLCGRGEEAILFFIRSILEMQLHEHCSVKLYDFAVAFFYFIDLPLVWVLQMQRDVLQSGGFWDFGADFDSSKFENNLVIRRKKHVFLWGMHLFWNVKHFFNSLLWIENYPLWRWVLAELLEHFRADFRADSIESKTIESSFIEAKKAQFAQSGSVSGAAWLDFAMYVEFYIYHKFGNSAHTDEDWAKYNKEIVKLVEPYFVEFGSILPPCKNKADSIESNIESGGIESKKRKIAFLKERVVLNSPFKVEYSLISALSEQKDFTKDYEIYVYSQNYTQKTDDDMACLQDLAALGAKVIAPAYEITKRGYFYSHLARALSLRAHILKDEIEVLISTGTNDCSDLLFCARSAPIQIYYSHGNGQYDMAGIDKRISHFLPSSPYPILQFSVPMNVERFYNPTRSKEQIESERKKYPISENTVVLGTIGRLTKMDNDEFISTIAEVLKAYPHAIYLACGSGNIVSIQERAKKFGVEKQIFCTGHIDAHIYGHLIDIFVNTFPLGQGESFSEYIHKNRGAFISYVPYTLDGVAKKGERAWELKYSDKLCVYCKNLEKLNPATPGFFEFMKSAEAGELCFVYNKKDLNLHEQIAPYAEFVELDDKQMEKMGDNIFHIKEDGSTWYDGGYFVRGRKKHCFAIYEMENMKFQYEMAKRWFNEFVDENGMNVSWNCTGRTLEEFKQNLGNLIEHKEYRNMIASVYEEYYPAQYKIAIKELKESFLKALNLIES